MLFIPLHGVGASGTFSITFEVPKVWIGDEKHPKVHFHKLSGHFSVTSKKWKAPKHPLLAGEIIKKI